MAISAKVRAEVMERDHRECQFWCGGQPATEVAHRDHQGIGGLPPGHWKNQPPNLAAACGACHRRTHEAGWDWVEFTPGLLGPGLMVINDPNGDMVDSTDLWFYNRWIKQAAIVAAQSLQTVSTIDNAIGQMMCDLRNGAEFLAGAKTFDEHISGLGWDPIKANEIADIFEWAGGLDCGWPETVNYSKMELLHGIDWSERSPVPFVESAAGGDSYATIQASLVKAKLKQVQYRIYALVGSPFVGDAHVVYIRTREEAKLVQLALERGLAVIKVNAFKGRLYHRRGLHGGLFDKQSEEAIEMKTFEEWDAQINGK